MEFLFPGMLAVTFFLFVIIKHMTRTPSKASSISSSSSSNDFVVHIIHRDGQPPCKGTRDSAGWDLRSRENVILEPFTRGLIMTGISASPPKGSYIRIAPRSGLAHKKGLDVGAGVIDPDYTGEIGVVLFNHSTSPVEIIQGQRIAQMILTKYNDQDKIKIRYGKEDEGYEEEVDYFSSSSTTRIRGSGGFGSTGYH